MGITYHKTRESKQLKLQYFVAGLVNLDDKKGRKN